MATTDATLTNAANVVVFEGTITGDLSGLPTGWTQDASDPSNVSSNDGNLDLGAGELDAESVFTTGLLNANSLGVVGNVGFYGTSPVAQGSVTGMLSAVLDANAKDVLTSMLAVLVNLGLAADGTT